jgi:N4-gp56 family major capsid protein
MAFLNPNTVTDLSAFIPEIWAQRVYQEALAKMWWERFTGLEGSGMPVVRKTELLTQPGDTIHVTRLADLTGDGVSGETTAEGTEEKLSIATIDLIPDWIRKPTSVTGKANKQSMQNFRQQAMMSLSRWLAKKMDRDKWTAASLTTPVGFDTAVIETIYGGTATSVNEIVATDDYSVAEIRKAAAQLRASDISGISIPGLPGMEYYPNFIHPYQALSLKQDSEWINAQHNSAIRGKDNPMFTGALGEIDGVVIYETTHCKRALNANSPAVQTARAIMMGAEALAHAENIGLGWKEQFRDYEFEQGILIEIAYQDKVLAGKAIKHIVTAAVAP